MSDVGPQQRGVRMFLVPEEIVTNGSLKTLSPNAMALYLCVAYRWYRMRSADVRMSVRDLMRQCNQSRNDLQAACKELRSAGLLYFQQTKTLMAFQIQQTDGSKAKVYLHPPKPAPPVPDVIKIEVV